MFQKKEFRQITSPPSCPIHDSKSISTLDCELRAVSSRPLPRRADRTEPTVHATTSGTPTRRGDRSEPTARATTSGAPNLRQTPGQKQKPHSALGGRQAGTSASPSLHPTPLLPAHLPAPKCSTCLSQSHQHWVLDEELFDGHEQ